MLVYSSRARNVSGVTLLLGDQKEDRVMGGKTRGEKSSMEIAGHMESKTLDVKIYES